MMIGCSKNITNHGKHWLDEDINHIKVGKSTRQDIVAKLGSPNIVDNNFPNHMVYVYHKNASKAFLPSKIIEYKALEFILNPKSGKLTKVKKYKTTDLKKFKFHPQVDVLNKSVKKITKHFLDQEGTSG